MFGLWAILSSLFGPPDGRAPAQPEADVAVAAVMYMGQNPASVDPACKLRSDCAVEVLVRQAAARGAKLVVTPEYAFFQDAPEPEPVVGDAPGSSEGGPLLARFSAVADELDVYLVINLETVADEHRYNTQVAFDPDGTVVAKHHKFELYAGEKDKLTRGTGVSAFETPFGTVGLLICADIYGPPRFHDRLVSDLGVSIVAFSAMWTVSEAPRWQAAFARDWGVHLVAANSSVGPARGGGVFDAEGNALARYDATTPGIVVARVPAR